MKEKEIKSNKPQHIRENNLEYIEFLLKKYTKLSQKELAQLSGLSIVTIKKILETLLENGSVQESDKRSITGGRSARLYEYNPRHKLLLVVQLTETEEQMRGVYSICDMQGKSIYEEVASENALSWVGISTRIRELIDRYEAIAAIAFGVPGVEVQGKLKVIDFPSLLNFELEKNLIKQFDLPIVIENDINAALLGYSSSFHNRESIAVGLYYPMNFPPGAAIVINGQILKGKNGLAGEVKSLPLEAKWQNYPRIPIDIEKNIREVIQTIISIYDPDRIILYTNPEMVSSNQLKQIEEELRVIYPYIDLPVIKISTFFTEDYMKGLIVRGLETIEDADRFIGNDEK